MLLIGINEMDPTPVYKQIVDGIREQLVAGQLNPGDTLPSVRELSKYLNVNVNTVNKAYQILKELQLINIRPAIGTVVAPNIRELLGSELNESALETEIVRMFKEGRRLGFDVKAILKCVHRLSREYAR